MIPLRRQLIVEGNMEICRFRKGRHAPMCWSRANAAARSPAAYSGGWASAAFYTWLKNSMHMWPDQPEYLPKWLPGASFRAAITSEYLGVGYIIGPKTAGTIFAGGVFSWLVLMPLRSVSSGKFSRPTLSLDDSHLSQNVAGSMWHGSSYVRPIGAGAVAAAGLITLLRTFAQRS